MNYSRVREVEKELAQLQLQLRITAGPKRSALELIRKKIELQNAKVVAARDRYKVAKQVRSKLCRLLPLLAPNLPLQV